MKLTNINMSLKSMKTSKTTLKMLKKPWIKEILIEPMLKSMRWWLIYSMCMDLPENLTLTGPELNSKKKPEDRMSMDTKEKTLEMLISRLTRLKMLGNYPMLKILLTLSMKI